MREYESKDQDLAMLRLIHGLGRDDSDEEDESNEHHDVKMRELDQSMRMYTSSRQDSETKAHRKMRQQQ